MKDMGNRADVFAASFLFEICMKDMGNRCLDIVNYR